MKKYSIDRIEGEIALCLSDDGKIKELALNELPKKISEGDILTFDGKEYRIDLSETAKRREETRRVLERLKRK